MYCSSTNETDTLQWKSPTITIKQRNKVRKSDFILTKGGFLNNNCLYKVLFLKSGFVLYAISFNIGIFDKLCVMSLFGIGFVISDGKVKSIKQVYKIAINNVIEKPS